MTDRRNIQLMDYTTQTCCKHEQNNGLVLIVIGDSTEWKRPTGRKVMGGALKV